MRIGTSRGAVAVVTVPEAPAEVPPPSRRPHRTAAAAGRRRRASLAPVCAAACLLAALVQPGGPSRAETAPRPAAAGAAPDCAGLRGARRLTYGNPRWGFALAYPSSFVPDPGSVPEDGSSARFSTADGRATAVVTGLRNGMGQSLAELLREARQDIAENGKGSVTYERATPGWFVLSGYLADRIYYRRTFLARGGRVIATLWIEFPRGLRPCLEEAVTTMSLSFREAPAGPLAAP